MLSPNQTREPWWPAQGSIAVLLALVAAGCTLTPRGLGAERAAVAAAAEWRAAADPKGLPAPADGDDWRAFLRRALLANGDVRAAWFEWRAAVAEVSGASEWPNTSLAFGYSRAFSSDAVKSFDRNSFGLGVDTMQNLSFPAKTMASGRATLAEAQAAGQRFRAAKFRVQRRALEAWLDLALAAENARLARQSATLAMVASDAAEAALRAGEGQGSAFSARIDTARDVDAVADAEAQAAAARAVLAATAALASPRDVALPTRLPAPRALPDDPSALAEALDRTPLTRELEDERRRAQAALDLAELQWIPDVNPTAAFTGSMEQAVGLVAMLPTRFASIRSGIASAKAMRGAAAQRLRQARRDQRGELGATLAAAAGAARARRVLEQRALPDAVSATIATESAYAAGRAQLADVVEARLLQVAIRGEIAAAAIEREKGLAAIEDLLGTDLETLTRGSAPRMASAAPAATGPTENLR